MKIIQWTIGNISLGIVQRTVGNILLGLPSIWNSLTLMVGIQINKTILEKYFTVYIPYDLAILLLGIYLMKRMLMATKRHA